MIKIEKTLLFIIVLVLLVGAVSATETPQEDQSYTNDETVASDISTVSQDNKETIKFEEKNLMDDNPIKIGESKTRSIEKKTKDSNLKQDGIIEVHNYTELQNAVNNAGSASSDTTIRLLSGSYNNTETILWETTGMVLTIDGNGQTINGHQQQVFSISKGASMILKNITITNCNSAYGGAINNNGNLTITNSNLTQNNANIGGAILNRGNLTITNSNLQYNNADTENGGAIYNGGTLNITHSNITHNTAERVNAGYGGAIYNVDISSITDTNLQYNNANRGGAIHNGGTLNITHSNITHNTAKENGGAIHINSQGILDIRSSDINNNTAPNGGAIYNYASNVTIYESTLNNNQGLTCGGVIYDYTGPHWNTKIILFNSNFTENKAVNGTVLYNIGGYGNYTITYNTFKNNTASGDKETLNLGSINDRGRTVEKNTYDNTDINLTKINLTTQKTKYQYNEDIILNYTIQLTNNEFYDLDILDKINKTLYIDTIENSTTKEKNYTLSKLKAGHHTILYKTCNSESNNLTLTVTGDSEIKTDKTTYDHVGGIKNKITLDITDPSGEKGRIELDVYESGVGYKLLAVFDNVNDGYTLSTETIAQLLENYYGNLDSSYVIGLYYVSYSQYSNPKLTRITLNINKQRNTTIVYDILNNTEGNVQINITVQDAIYKTPINDANIKITGDIKQNTTSGILTDNTLTPGEYKITVQYPETDDYKESNATINFIVEIDKDAKIADLEGQVENLTEKLEQANENIENLTNQLDQANNEIETLNNTISNLTTQLEDAENKISTLNSTIENITQQLEQAREEIETLNNTIKELTRPPLNTTITITPIKSSVGSIVNLSANVKDQNGEKVSGGKVIFKVNGITLKDEYNNVLYATLTDGLATLKYKVQDVWMKNTSYVEAVYGGNENYTSSRTKSSNILNITEGIAKVSLDKSSFKVKSGETITLRAKIVDANGDNINRGKVVFKLNGKTLTDKNGKTLQAKVVNGEAILEYTIPAKYSAKTYTLTAVYGGEGYKRSETSGKLVLTKKGVTINTDSITTNNGKTTVKATITDETGDLLVRNTSLAIKVNEKTILKGVNSTDGKIDVSFVTTLRPGMYELQIVSGENGIYKTGRMTTVLRI